MRKITQQAINAFMSGKPFSKDNTSVKVENTLFPLVHLFLHGNMIAKRYEKDGEKVLMVTDAGWQTVTTKERLNGIPGVSIYQKKGVWYLNNEKWFGGWTTI